MKYVYKFITHYQKNVYLITFDHLNSVISQIVIVHSYDLNELHGSVVE
jgi:hypothetical protein